MKSCNKVAIVTGAAMGYKAGGPSIGGAISIKLADNGYNIVVVDLLDMGKRTVELIKEKGSDAVFIKADVTVTEEVKKIVRTTKDIFGGLNCLVNSVQRYTSGNVKNIADISEEDWIRTLDVNLNSYFRMAKYSIPLMLESDGGTIINISSLSSRIVVPNYSVYSVSKAAINALTKTIAVDFAPKIRANAVLPGYVKVANSEGNWTPEELEIRNKKISKQYPMGRLCEAAEIANVVSFLASEQSSYITGQSIIVDGGKIVSDSFDY